MNTIIRVTLFISIMTSALWADEYISLENNRGNALIAKLILLDEDKLHFERNDGTAFTIEMSTLNQKSQERVLRHFRTTLDVPDQKHLDIFEPLTADQVFYSEDKKHIVRSIYVDKAKDHLPIHPYPEMDITELTIKKLSGDRIEVTMVFLEDLPNTKITDAPYRIWLKLNLDCDDTTGQQETTYVKGTDLSIAINGHSANSEWSYYKVKKSDIGRESNIEITDIRAQLNSLSFIMEGDSMNRNEVFKLRLSSCSMGGRNVDTIPDRGWLKIDHVNHTR
ncbi:MULTISPECIES: hypothetical protein [unclassified Lentimonas]|uniref:hypothetical protein n=1 Tax=unclassified Lentimonas TaxID=2630993 RepID=UPI0013231324|nr:MULTISPECIES: hypothetical protein [unclassified Lentimonas]CAA6693202.1 Unannotated [Lentimonas sp. CC10]CAA6695508.1 Unannotated [Lentimonas sp. CC19]CAA7071727.1 Unannotated [Lentimonas sp. CC11]